MSTRGQGFVQHFRDFPRDVPRLADVVARRLEGIGHVATKRPDLVDTAANYVERQRPNWATSGHIDAAVTLVLELVEEAIDTGSTPW